MKRLEGKVAVVTGSSSGLGRAIAVMFAQEGAKVLVNADSNVAGGQETVRMIKDAGGEAIFVQADVSKSADCKRMMRAAVDAFGRIDVLVNNAGVEIRGGVMSLTEEEWDAMLGVDLKGIFLCSREAIPEMIKVGGGSIINVTSVLSFDVIPERAAYCAAKAGAVHLTRSIALDYAKHNIRCNALGPGAFHTPLLDKSMRDSGDYEGTMQVLKNKSVFGRMGEPEEAAAVAVFLASDESSFVTGSVYQVDGGWFLG
ncbi:MAG: glucose 1-dehydrogenase [Chloroflexi bacterium]|nr:glucose 1-dehydrogenase [Chloroflexota bacterium]